VTSLDEEIEAEADLMLQIETGERLLVRLQNLTVTIGESFKELRRVIVEFHAMQRIGRKKKKLIKRRNRKW